MSKPRLSIVYYLNALPLSWGFLRGSERGLFDLDFSPPSRCADLLAKGDVDVGLIPAIEYQRIGGLKIVPKLSVASKHQVKSVLLLSRVPAEQIRTIAADSSSRTSVCLLQILLRARFKIAPAIESHGPDLNAMLRRHDAALIIGDAALKSDSGKLFGYDLAEEWRALTGKPFVFAFWGVRGSVGLPDAAAFQRSFEYGKARSEEIVEEQTRQLELPADLIRSYITENIDYSLDEENLKGLRLFYQLAREYRLIESVRELEFIG
ncbi:MAG: menaquinone biosynthesis protein [Acidobacteria bacterium]|nr:menaquinone biosynthesis protein [Acidobacteriota bacterium]MCI0626854.1 menaquinone biosynthesis protein [Acidobacteriota bacterium]MCI0722102.1 menaquinone biosynthesis protein [Acidobacteriota bacterium]